MLASTRIAHQEHSPITKPFCIHTTMQLQTQIIQSSSHCLNNTPCTLCRCCFLSCCNQQNNGKRLQCAKPGAAPKCCPQACVTCSQQVLYICTQIAGSPGMSRPVQEPFPVELRFFADDTL
jgi:hypothetical protein